MNAAVSSGARNRSCPVPGVIIPVGSSNIVGHFERPKVHIQHDARQARWQQCQSQQRGQLISRHQGSALKYHGFADSQIGTRHQPIIGQARDMQIRVALAPDVELTVTCVDINCSKHDLRAYINSQGILHKDVEVLQEGPNYNTFYVKVSQSDMTKVRNSSFWPEGIFVRKFYHSRQKYLLMDINSYNNILWNDMKLMSFNCKHFYESGSKLDFINQCVEDCDYLFLQEHCLYESQFWQISIIGGGMGVEAKRSMDESLCKEGRKYEGCAILWKPNVKGKIDPVECKNNRLCGILVCIANDVTILLLNTYMPCDSRSHDHHHAEMVDVLREVEHTMLKYGANYTIFGGDLNTDISTNTAHTASLLEFVSEYDMTICIEVGHVNIPYTYICKQGNETFTSKVDNFIVCKSLCDNFVECFIMDEFYSDHAAVKMSISVAVPHIDMKNEVIVHSDLFRTQ